MDLITYHNTFGAVLTCTEWLNMHILAMMFKFLRYQNSCWHPPLFFKKKLITDTFLLNLHVEKCGLDCPTHILGTRHVKIHRENDNFTYSIL